MHRRPRRQSLRIVALVLEGLGLLAVLAAAWHISLIVALVLAGLCAIGAAQVLEDLL